jgi:protoporphyrinogen oxidase
LLPLFYQLVYKSHGLIQSIKTLYLKILRLTINNINTDTLIIGAGPAGLATAMELLRAGKDFVVVDKDSQVGGLAKTYKFKEGNLTFLTDNGPHRFFSKNQYLYDFIEDLIDEKWIKVSRQTRQYIDGKFYDYPVNAAQALQNLGFKKSVKIGIDYGLAKIRYGLFKKKINNFEDYVVANFGRTLGEFNMINYTEKIWGIPARDIHADWAGQRIKGLSLLSLVKDASVKGLKLKSKNKPKTLIDTFFYPESGTGLIYETILKRIAAKGHKVLLSTTPTKINHSKNKINSVELNSPDGPLKITFKTLVESIQLPSFIKLLSPAPPKAITKANNKLRYRSQVYVFITLNKPFVNTDQWIYFPSKDTPIARISEMKNFSSAMAPKDKTSLFVELFCFEGDEIWNMTDEKIYELVASYLEKIKFFKRSEIRKHYIIRAKDVYPVYDTRYQDYLSVIKEYLDSFNNLFYIGRPGRFRYNNQDHSLEMGILAAKSIVENKRYNIDKVGGEKEYFESGNLRQKKDSKDT